MLTSAFPPLLIMALLLLARLRPTSPFHLPAARPSSSSSSLLLNRLSSRPTTRLFAKVAGPYAQSVILPETTFNQRADAINREPELQSFWSGLPLKLAASRADQPPFTLHDGPPYANGDLHIGHALNKILKDVINRRALLKGFQVNYTPGWDCHGLPIELKVLQSMKASERKDLTPIDLRTRAAAFAKETVAKQVRTVGRAERAGQGRG